MAGPDDVNQGSPGDVRRNRPIFRQFLSVASDVLFLSLGISRFGGFQSSFFVVGDPALSA